MTEDEAYMLHRNAEESSRLDEQHEFFKEVFGGHLLNPAIPGSKIESVADVGTGTGTWLEQTSQWLRSAYASEQKQWNFVGFDISSQQFPKIHQNGVDFVEHDATRIFPEEFHAAFDVVHVRLLSYAIKAKDVERLVRNVVQLIKPGGYLDWQEGDAIDSWTVPETASMRKRCLYVVSERIARGLTPAFVTPLLKTLQTLQKEQPDRSAGAFNPDIHHGSVNLMSWNNDDALRILQVQTCSTSEHPSAFVNERKTRIFNQAGTIFMTLGASRRNQLASEPQTSPDDAKLLRAQADEMKSLATHADFRNSQCEADLTSILARKAVFASRDSPWNALRHP